MDGEYERGRNVPLRAGLTLARIDLASFCGYYTVSASLMRQGLSPHRVSRWIVWLIERLVLELDLRILLINEEYMDVEAQVLMI